VTQVAAGFEQGVILILALMRPSRASSSAHRRRRSALSRAKWYKRARPLTALAIAVLRALHEQCRADAIDDVLVVAVMMICRRSRWRLMRPGKSSLNACGK